MIHPMSKLIFLFILIACAAFQLTFANYFRFFAITPDFILASAIIANLILEFRWALLLSLFAGILKDSFGASAFGINTVLFSFWSILIRKLSAKVSLYNDAWRSLLAFIIVLFHNVITGLLLIYTGENISLGHFLRITFVVSLYTTLIFVLLFKFITSIPALKPPDY